MDYNKYFEMEVILHQQRMKRLNVRTTVKAAFFSDAMLELGISDHPKGRILMDISWDLGHAHGYQEVYTYAETLLPLIR